MYRDNGQLRFGNPDEMPTPDETHCYFIEFHEPLDYVITFDTPAAPWLLGGGQPIITPKKATVWLPWPSGFV